MLELTLVPLSEIKLNPKNRNKHPAPQIERLCEIIKYQGFRRPVTISKRSGFLSCGEGRYLAAKKMKLESIPAMYQDYESEAQEYADGIADNAIDKWAELDLTSIMNDLGDLGKDFDTNMLGIDGFKIKIEETPGEDEIPEHVEPKTKLGDLYQLGNHRLLCGDSTSIDAVEKLMNGEKADMVFTDIPYNISQKSNGLRNIDYGEWDKGVQDIGLKTLHYEFADSFYYFCGDEQLSDLLKAFKALAFSTRTFVWHKTNPTVMNGEHIWLPSQELCAYAKKPNAIFNLKCEHAFYEGAPNGNRVHPNQKPIELVQKCIEASSNGSVVDFFGGSGSTLIACEKTKRKCFMMELDPHYCDVIVARWEKYSGGKAQLL